MAQHKLKSGSIIVNPSDLQQGAVQDLLEDRSSYLRSDEPVTWTGTELQFTQDIVLEIVNTANGTVTQHIVQLADSPIQLNDLESAWVEIDRSAASENLTVNLSDTLPVPAHSAQDKDVIVLFRRVDAGGAGYLHIPLHKQVLEPGQTVRLGASGSGDGSGGAGDDINTLKFRASFRDAFREGPTSPITAVSLATATYNAADSLYRMSYDASQTVTGTGTSMTLSAAPAYTAAVGDMLVVGSEARRITALGSINVDGGSGTPFTVSSAFTSDPTAAAACVSQAVHTVDIRAYTANSSGLPISSLIPENISSYMLWYRDSLNAGDDIWDFPGAALVAFIASSDATSYSDVQTRASALSDDEPIRLLPTEDSQFVVSFFSAATSGTGGVNLLDYKAYLHEDNASSSGQDELHAVARTDGAGTEVNCSVSSDTGKTRVTTTFSFGSILHVYLDGKKIPEFVDSTLTPDASYTKLTANVVELDSDYSGAGLQIEIEVPVNTVDNTELNSVAISEIHDMVEVGFNPFVDESARLTAVNGVPGVGQFRTFGVQNRASIPDLANDLKARMGIDRIVVQEIYRLQDEYGPNFASVYAAYNDSKNQIRFVGTGWRNVDDSTNGPRPQGENLDDFVEIVFYGTGLNLLTHQISGGSRDYRATIDNGAEGGNFYINGSSILSGRSYTSHQVVNVATSLSLGLHTVKIRNAGSANLILSGFEVLNQSSTVNVRPGVAYSGGRKLVSSISNDLSYNSSFEEILREGAVVGSLGSRGARALIYQKSDGSIAKSAYAVNASQGNIGSADHTYESVNRVHHWREFGTSRSDDFSTLTSSASNRAFTLDDNTTSLTGVNTRVISVGADEVINFGQASTADTLNFTFVGTGLSVSWGSDGTATGISVTVDGTSIGSFGPPASAGVIRTQNVVSGLPYGTHTVVFASTNVTSSVAIKEFIVYGPKKPTLPAGAVELADYDIMADYSPTLSTGVNQVSAGVLRKSSAREWVYSGAGFSATLVPTESATGWLFRSPTNGDYYEYTFFGTGFDFTAHGSSGTASATLSIDGALYTGSASVVGTATWTPGTSTFTFSAVAGAGRLRVTGLSLGLHVIRFTINGAQNLNLPYVDFITPIYAAKVNLPTNIQNSLSVGSCALSDTRKLTPIKDQVLSSQVALARGIASSPSTTVTAYFPVPDMTLTIKVEKTASYLILFNILTESFSGTPGFAIMLNGQVIEASEFNVGGNRVINALSTLTVLSPGAHKIDGAWRAGAGTLTVREQQRSLKVVKV